jgi:hypothetical protein
MRLTKRGAAALVLGLLAIAAWVVYLVAVVPPLWWK